jgi:hypothetical protein
VADLVLIEHRLLVVMAVQAVADHLIADLVDRQHQAKEITAVTAHLVREKQAEAAALEQLVATHLAMAQEAALAVME